MINTKASNQLNKTLNIMIADLEDTISDLIDEAYDEGFEAGVDAAREDESNI